MMSTSTPSRTPDRDPVFARQRPVLLASPAEAGGAIGLCEAVTETELVGSARARRRNRETSDRHSALLSGGTFLVVASLWLVLAPPTEISLTLLVCCVAVHALASSVEFEIGPGSAVPTTPVLMAALLLLPPQAIPWVTLAGLALAAEIAHIRDRSRRDSLLVSACSAWHALGPAMIFWWWDAPADHLSWAILPRLAAALLAQFVFDVASTWVRTCYGLGVPFQRLRQVYRFTILVDLALAPVGIAATMAAPGSVLGLAFVIPPIGLLAILQTDRRQVIDRTLLLSQAVSESDKRARTDVLTKLSNRLAWEERLALLSNSEGPVGVVLLDVDGLKKANDSFGHEIGDQLLVAIANLVAANQPSDPASLAARLGGDEFGIILPGELAAQSSGIASRLQRQFEATPPIGQVVPVSASVGSAIAIEGSMLMDTIDRADQAVNLDKVRRGMRRQ